MDIFQDIANTYWKQILSAWALSYRSEARPVIASFLARMAPIIQTECISSLEYSTLYLTVFWMCMVLSSERINSSELLSGFRMEPKATSSCRVPIAQWPKSLLAGLVLADLARLPLNGALTVRSRE